MSFNPITKFPTTLFTWKKFCPWSRADVENQSLVATVIMILRRINNHFAIAAIIFGGNQVDASAKIVWMMRAMHYEHDRCDSECYHTTRKHYEDEDKIIRLYSSGDMQNACINAVNWRGDCGFFEELGIQPDE